jgi:hypothetical protein
MIKKARRPFSRTEYLFNLISIVILLTITLYFGYRCFYYYSKETNEKKANSGTLATAIITNNKITKTGSGLYQDNDGYYFKGNVTNNYVKFANRLFRIVRLNSNNTTKLVSADNVSTFYWGTSNKYRQSNLYNWLTKTTTNSGIYYDTIPDLTTNLVKTTYSEDILNSTKVKVNKKTYQDYVTTLTVSDYIASAGRNGYLNINRNFFLLGLDSEANNLYVTADGDVETATNYDAYGIRSVITLGKKIRLASGTGSMTDPYIVNSNNNNYVDSYVKLGNDTWKVFSDDGATLKLSLNGYISYRGSEYLLAYGTKSSLFNPNLYTNVGYYLNKTYYNSLPYKIYLLDTIFNTGEISTDAGLDYFNIYKNEVSAKVGLLNIFDYNTNTSLNNYDYLNTTSEDGTTIYIYNNMGIIDEGVISAKKHLVPVISIAKSNLTTGNGTEENPYQVG